MPFKSEEEAIEFAKRKTANDRNLIAWIEAKNGKWYVYFNVWD